MRRPAAAALVFVALLVLAGPVAAGPVLDDPDAIELANALVDATDEHGICYGWDIFIDDRGTRLTDIGSNLGPGVAVHEGACERYIVLHVTYYWTAESSEQNDTAAFHVLSNVPGAPTEADLRRIGIDGDDLLKHDDTTVYNATLALPALAAEAGLGPAIPLEENDGTVPSSDRPDPEGSDWMRQYGWVLAVFGVMIAGGLLWLVYEIVLRPNQLHRWQR